MKASLLFELPDSLSHFKKYFLPEQYPWEWVGGIKQALQEYDFVQWVKPEAFPGSALKIEGPVFIDSSVKLPHFGYIKGPVYIGPECTLRNGVNIRGNVIAGKKCVLGNACEYKNCLLMDRVETPHFNYVGDSVLGTGAHLGAGAITANLRLDRGCVRVDVGSQKIETSFKKLGALVGEFAQVGCNAVLQPGSILGKNAIVGSLVAFNGFLPEMHKSFAKSGSVEKKTIKGL